MNFPPLEAVKAEIEYRQAQARARVHFNFQRWGGRVAHLRRQVFRAILFVVGILLPNPERKAFYLGWRDGRLLRDQGKADKALDEAWDVVQRNVSAALETEKPSGPPVPKKPPLMQGQQVKVYRDPLTRQNMEGTVLLLYRLQASDADGLECWEVRFDGEMETYPRWVHPSDQVGGEP